MSLLDPEDKIFEDALKRAFMNNAREVIKSGSVRFERCALLDREYKIVTGNYFVGEIVWSIDPRNWRGSNVVFYALYVDEETGPNWIKIDL